MRPRLPKTTIRPALLAAALVPLSPAGAHHSFAMFDSDKVTTLRGEVSEFRWVNPHVALFVKVDGSNDPAKLWAIELTSPGNLRRIGWSRNSLKPGDKVAVEINPLRDGKHGGGFRKATLLDTGQVVGADTIAIERDSQK